MTEVSSRESLADRSRHRLCMLACTFWLGGMTAQFAIAAEGDASSPSWTWQPRAGSIVIERGQTSEKNGTELRVRGRIETGWNYISSNQRPIPAGGLYRLSAEVRVDRLGPGTPMPYLKCEFVAAQSGRELGQAHTESYDGSRPGAWQRLTGEFKVPEGTRACWLALEKGTSAPTEIDATLRDVRLEPITRFTALERYRLKPIPPTLEALRGVHPRLYLNERRVAELRKALSTTHAEIWKEVRAQADRAVRRGPPSYIKDDGHSGDEQLWQRSVGNTLPLLAISYVLTGEKVYLDSARKWALASCGYPTWGLGRIDGMDLAAGHQLFGLALVYDWCYHDLDAETLKTIRQTLQKRAGAMYEAAATGKAWWRRSYLQNHLWVDSTGLAAAGFALFDEEDEASGWIGFPLDIFQRTMAALGPDGASHEGVGYWEYGVEYMLKFMDLSRSLLGVELGERDWWRNTSRYALYLSLPRNAWSRGNCIVDLADCPRSHWYGPDYLLRNLAHRFHDGQAQWLAQEIETAGVASPEASWLNLIWYDPTIAAESPRALPTLHHFADMEILSARSGWTGDESLVVFKCGPFLGHEAVERFSYDPGGGHVHPDANHFVIFGAGEWLLRDDGYQPKWTGQHNTLLINGRGQMGEGKQWFDGGEPLAHKAQPTILHVASTPTFDHGTGDATAAYAPELGLKRFQRHLIFLKPDVLIIADEIHAETSIDLELRFHPEATPVQNGNVFLARGKKAVLKLEALTTEGVQLSQGPDPRVSRLVAVRLTTHRASWRNAVALSWSAANAEPAAVKLQSDGDRWTFTSHNRKLTLDWSTGRVGE